jgi:hypothetical protein
MIIFDAALASRPLGLDVVRDQPARRSRLKLDMSAIGVVAWRERG